MTPKEKIHIKKTNNQTHFYKGYFLTIRNQERFEQMKSTTVLNFYNILKSKNVKAELKIIV